MTRAVLLATWTLAVSGCARDAAARAEAPLSDQGAPPRAEAVTPSPVDPWPTGDAAILPDGYLERARVALAEVRGNPLEPEVRRFLDQIPAWRRLIDDVGFDPVDEVDRVIFGAPTPTSRDWIVLLRLRAPIPRARVRDVVEAYAAPRDVTWAERGRVVYGTWRGPRPGVSRAALRGPGGRWVAIVPGQESRRVVATLDRADPVGLPLYRDERLPWSGETSVAPGRPGVGMLVEGAPRRAGGAAWGADPPESSVVTGSLDDAGGVRLRWTATYHTPEAADHALARYRARHEEVIGSPVVGLLGLREPLEAARWSADPERPAIAIEVALTLRHAGLLLRFLTPMILSAR